MFASLPNSYVEILTSSVAALGAEAFGKRLGHKGGALKNEISALIIKEIPESSLNLSAIRVVSSAYLRLLIFLPVILIPACASSSPA